MWILLRKIELVDAKQVKKDNDKSVKLPKLNSRGYFAKKIKIERDSINKK